MARLFSFSRILRQVRGTRLAILLLRLFSQLAHRKSLAQRYVFYVIRPDMNGLNYLFNTSFSLAGFLCFVVRAIGTPVGRAFLEMPGAAK